MMAVVSTLISHLALDQIFFSGDIKTTTVAIAITGSLCCSIVWLIVHLLVTINPESTTFRARRKSKGDSVASFHIKRASSLQNRKNLQKQSSSQRKHLRQVLHRDSLSVICISCGLNEAHWTCRLVLCETCCLSSKYTTCDLGLADIDARVKVSNHDVKKPKEIDLSYFQLTSCPSRIGYVGAQLSVLNLSNNCLSDLPKEIGFLLGLEELYIQYNGLKELPDSIGNLSKLTELDVKHNSLTSLPDSIGNLSSLNVLNLMNNKLVSLPQTIGQLTSLEVLYASNNNLIFLPEELCDLSQLNSLHLCGNQSLSILPENMGNLVRLAECDVSDCNLIHLPNSFSKCRALVKVWCSNNRLISLPEHIGQLHQLRELHIRDNNCQHLPASMVHLDLYVFSAMHNPLYEENHKEIMQTSQKMLHPAPVATLVELAARFITIRKIPWDHENLPAILKDLLLSRRNCSMCECPVFEHFFLELKFQTISIAQRIPVHTQLCEQCFQVGRKKTKTDISPD
ncbi:leucine-rich repeat-containing protein 69 isoform X2 [Lingula anatina]|uniref:Leucine-rich repeat-containing protein 69 isoform X2 n=1 Tax=Lingula anatina TaxID=7574 RepID=A0A1S3J7C4_LINAN|nr:leucine-rich repeat-containing protein 69 isoform X2 [Lingula anatina]|eukprot:XP_013406141.1 leucine-rich repeat-containing protein 69 isoform X2 [Lingula anatina]